jgi:hypothetical protein
VAERLECRRLGIQKFMFPSIDALVMQHLSPADHFIWVDGDTLQSFLACDTRIDYRLKARSPILSSTSSLCPHGKFHPRDTRKGKLLRKSQWDAYVALLEAERKYIAGVDPMVVDSPIVEMPASTTAGSLICEKCHTDYSDELQQKIAVVQAIKDLYDDISEILQPNEAALYYSDDWPLQEEDQYAYAVAKTSLTRFRKNAEALFTSVSNFHRGGTPDQDKPLLVMAGIDDLNLCEFPAGRALCGMENLKGAPSEDDYENFALLNKRITCKFLDGAFLCPIFLFSRLSTTSF